MIHLSTDDEATAKLLAGGVGVMPTDTVYGIVARAHDQQAVKRFYALKQREHKPGTVIAASIEQLIDLGVEEKYLRRVEKLWPASLSVETPLGPNLAYLHQDTGRQGFRVVADERVRHILEQTGPLVTSSANQPDEPTANTVEEAFDYFGDSVDFYVDGGDLSGRAPSTIMGLMPNGQIEIYRQGAVEVDPSLLQG
jgi:L-threonylcarbamoyladenylate synthase